GEVDGRGFRIGLPAALRLAEDGLGGLARVVDEGAAEDMGALPGNDPGVEDVALRQRHELAALEDLVLLPGEELPHPKAEPGAQLLHLEGGVDASGEGLQRLALLGREGGLESLQVGEDGRLLQAVERAVEEEVLEEGGHPGLEAPVLLVRLTDALEIGGASLEDLLLPPLGGPFRDLLQMLREHLAPPLSRAPTSGLRSHGRPRLRRG